MHGKDAINRSLLRGIPYHQIRFNDFAYNSSAGFFSLNSVDEQPGGGSTHFKTVLVNAGERGVGNFGDV